MAEHKENLIQGSLDDVLKDTEETDLSLGEKIIGRTADGKPIFPSESPQEEVYRKLQKPPPRRRRSTIKPLPISYGDQIMGEINRIGTNRAKSKK